MTKNTIMPIERAFDEYLEYCEFTRRMSRQTLSAQRRGAAAFNASAVLSGWISQFSPARFAALICYRHSAKWGDANGITGDARSFKRGNYAAIFAWTGRADGSML